MHVRDIINAIARDDVREIEAGFRALVGYPREEEIAGATPVTLMASLDATCDALAGDTSVMPRDTRVLFEGIGDEPSANTYAEGTASVQANRGWWEQHIAALCRRAA